MTGDALWWLVMVLAVVCTVLAVMLLRKPRVGRPDVPDSPQGVPAASAAPAGARPAPLSLATPSAANGLAPQPAAGVPQRNPVAALVAPPTVKPPTTLVAARARRYELRDGAPEPVLTLERAELTAWAHAPVVHCTPMQRDTLAAALAHAPLLAPPGLASTTILPRSRVSPGDCSTAACIVCTHSASSAGAWR